MKENKTWENRLKNLPYKFIVTFIVFTMVFTQMPLNQFVHAESNMAIVEVKEQDEYTKVLYTSVVQDVVKKLELQKDGKVLASKEVNDTLSFEVYTNGEYQLVGYGEKGTKLDTQDVSVDTFENSYIKMDSKTHQVTLLSRYEKTAQIKVEGSDTKTVDTVETKTGVYEAVYDVEKNGSYTFSILDSNKNVLGKESLDVNDVPNVNKAGEILLSNEDDLKQIITNPSSTFVLNQDIEMTSDLLKDVHFTGVLKGNGYTISGIQERLFHSISNAEISNIVIKGQLAQTSTNSKIVDAGFYVEANNNEKDFAVIMNSEGTIISNSFALMNVEGKNVSGFILDGTGSISNSYVSGYLRGKEVYGFGKNLEVKNSYITASLVGDTRVLFSNGELKDCFYDAQINDLEETKATPYYTSDLTSKKFSNQEFIITEKQYPQIKSIENMQEQAQQVSALSVLAVTSKSNLSALESAVQVEEKDTLEWTGDNASIVGGNASPSRDSGSISATQDHTTNRFALQKARAVSSIKASDSTTSTTTQITLPITMGNYYKVIKTGETPTLPTTHKEAIEDGWKLMYWSGDYKWTGLDWNTDYTVYRSDLSANTTVGTIKTNYGKLSGKLTLSGTYDFDQTMTATLSDMNDKTTKGTIYFETADTLDKSATWTTVLTTLMNGTATTADFIVNDAQAAKYLRARFVVDEPTGYKGELYATTDSIIKKSIKSVTIENKTSSSNYTLNDQLIASIDPSGKENDVDFTWYQKDVSEAIGTGRNYTLKSSDVGKQVYVKAVAKANGDVKGEVDSAYTSEVASIKCNKPDATNLKKITKEDITATIEMDVADSLYRFGIATSVGGEKVPYSILSRGKTHATITNLNANTTYYIYVQQVGENGYTDSDWSDDYLEIKTDNEHVRGDVVISGDAIYKKTLTANITNGTAGQKGNYAWYRLDADGNRGTTVTGNTYELKKEDIGYKIEAVYEGTDGYAGEVSTISNTITKEEKDPPANNLTKGTIADTTVDVTLPSNSDGEKYIIGISNTISGVPIEQTENGKVKEFSSNENYTIKDLERDTEYYVFIRYAENATHQKSNWIASGDAIQVKTNKKAFKGSIEFTYPTTNLMKGQTLTAEVTPEDTSFNYKGEWTWTRVASDGSTTVINNFALTDNKQGTTYVVPNNEDTGVTYKVTFSANVGYTGKIENTSSDVKAPVKEKYNDPDENSIVLESIDDESIKLMMADGEGQYKFYYKEDDTNAFDSMGGFFTDLFTGDDGYGDAGSAVGSNVDLVVSGLKRNTRYIVKVQRIGDDKGEASDFVFSSDATTAYTSVTTKKTDITGKVEIDGTTRYGETLTVKYTAGTYANKAKGTDTGGSWQWYRGTSKITGATNTTYILQKEDIGKTIKVEYTMPESDDFQGSASVSTKTIEKALCELPKIDGIETKDNDAGDLTMVITGNMATGDNIYYRVQKAEGSTTPDYPTSDEQLKAWNKVNAVNVTVAKDADNEKLAANTRYIVYFIKQASETNEGSTVMSKDYTMGTHSQKGTVTFTGNMVVGKTITATLKDANNTQGTWKWYMSTKTYPTITSVPNAATDSEWTEITSGYSPATNATSSELNVSEELFAHYIRAEFVANEDQGYSGVIQNTGTSSDYVKKIYEETLTLTSSTMDGNKKPKAYTNSIITGTINNYVEKGNLDRTTVQFKVGNTVVSGSDLTINDNTFTYKMPDNASYDNLEIIAEISKPKTIALYVDKDLKTLTAGTLNSKTSTSTSFTYTQGIPISNADDLENFMKGSSPYNDRSATYAITNNISLENRGNVDVTNTVFSGILDGQYHTISYAKNNLFQEVTGTASKYAEVKNIIFTNGQITGTDVAAISNRIKYYAKINKVFALNSNIAAQENVGLISSFVGNDIGGDPLRDTVIITECGSAGGTLSSNGNASLGGLVGFASMGVFYDNFSIGTTLLANATQTYVGGFIGHGTRVGGDDVRRNYTTAKFEISKTKQVRTGAFIGELRDSGTSVSSILENNYYDKQVVNNATIDAQSVRKPEKGTPKQTNEMIGNGLKTYFGDQVWSYSEGYYPRLKWIKDSPIAILYTATRGAFVSVDNATTNDNMFNGNISGVVQIPTELQTKDYTVTSSDSSILKVGDNGTIVPIGNVGQKATITITYTEPDATIGGSASNTYEFTVGKTVSAMSAVSIKDNTTNEALTSSDNTVAQGLPNPQMNETLKADSTQGASYQWYKRKSGTTTSTPISGATDKTYKLTSSDIGYEIAVLVSATGYASTYSPYTKATVAIKPTAPSVSEITDSSVVLKPVNGVAGLTYEFGYMRTDENASPTLIEGTCDKDGSIKVENLLRNKRYNFYVRVAAKSGVYDASDWSDITNQLLEKTEVSGNVSFGANINNGSNLSISIEKTNGQTGTWKLERVNTDSTTTVINESYSTKNAFDYPLTSADVGKKIKATFTGSGDFKGTVIGTSGTVKKTITNAPVSPVKVSDTYNSLTLKMENAGNYEIAYSDSTSSEKKQVKASASDENITINNLDRNKTYYVFARVNEITGVSEASEWSNPTQMTTGKEAMNVAGGMTMSGATKTDDTMTIKLSNGNNYTGTWTLYTSPKDSDTKFTISPSLYNVNTTTNEVTYKIRPKDAGKKLGAEFSGNGDFSGSIDTTSAVLNNAKLDATADMPTDITVSNIKDTSMELNAKDGNQNYQYGYVTKGGNVANIKAVDATGYAATRITVTELTRNTEYDIYVRKASETGYNASDWVKMPTGATTAKSTLTGAVSYQKFDPATSSWKDAKVGIAEMDAKYKATYTKGSYEDNADDSLSGHWQWYANDVAIENANTDTYTIEPMVGDVEITVKYVANDDASFKDARSAGIGTLTKPTYSVPTILPTVIALTEDGNQGSQLQITSSDVDNVYYYVQKVSVGTVPEVVLSSVADNNDIAENKWFKATSDMKLVLDPNTEYVVYVARLEDGGHKSSGVVSQRSVKTEKENLNAIDSVVISEADATKWKVQQEKELRVNIANKPVDGVWQYYVSKTPTVESSWQNITSEIKDTLKEGKEATYSYAKLTMPIKYTNGYYVKAIFTGRGNVEGTKIYTSTDSLIGTQIQGHVEINSGTTNEVFVPIEVTYVYAKDSSGADIKDEASGIWTWYRETAKNSNTYEEIVRTKATVGLSDTYTPTAEDVDKKIYAVYTGAPEGIYSGSVESAKLSNTERATQNTPDPITLKQVNGTTMQINLPSNLKVDGKTMAQPVLEYRKAGATDWIVNKTGDAWIGKGDEKLKANTNYEVRARFNGTSEYKPSDYTAIITVKTDNQSFDEDKLVITQPDVLETGSKVTAKFSGLGYDDGYFKVSRSDGTVLSDKVTGTVDGTTISTTYDVLSADIGSNIIVQYHAKDDASTYGGYIEKNTDEVLKPANPNKPGSPTLTTIRLHEDQLEVVVDDTCEYVLNTSATAVSVNSGDWKKLTKDSSNKYLFDNLTKGTEYYLHVRYVETENYRASDENISAKTSPWKKGEYNITYHGTEGATNTNPTKYTELDADITLVDAEKDGYTFTGWTTDEVTTPTKGLKIDSGSDGNKEFTANWDIISYNITYNLNDGTLESGKTNPLTYTVESDMFTLHNPAKTGYTFTGWTWEDQSVATTTATINKGTHKDLNFVANFTINKYIATFDVNGGNAINPNTVEREYNEALGTLPTPTRTGYTFDGWYTANTGGVEITKDTKMPVDGAMYYAHWTIEEYQITYELNGGSVSTPNKDKYTVESDTFTLTNPTKTGYTFKGWSGTDITDKQETITLSKGSVGNRTYTANWQLNEYTIGYDLAGGSVSPANKEKYTVESDDITLTNPKKKGYTFKGWSGTGITGKQETVTITKGSIGDKSYTANWELNEYTIGYDLVGGTVSTANKGKYTVEDEDFTLTNPTKKGYTFKGWSGTDITDKEDTVTITKGSIGNRTYTANWQIDTYTITYVLDGGTNHADNPLTYQVTDSTITLKEPSKTGYAFKGWKLNGTGELLTTVTIASGSTGNLSYSAVWQKVNYKVTFDSQGGSPVSETGADYQEKISKPVDPAKEGYTFKGWFKEAGCTNEWIFDTDVVEKATTLYAKWTINQYTVSFDGNGGIDGTAITKDYNEKLGNLPTATRTGYTFDGWYTATTGGDKITEDTKMPVDGATYFAHWKINQYTAKFDGNGGSNGTDIRVNYDAVLGTLPTSTRTGYTFDGWFTTKTGGDKITEDTKMPVDGATYYAHWTINQYTVRFDGNGGIDGTAITKDYNEKLGSLPTSTRTGYTFEGWFTAPTGGTKITVDTTIPAVNTTYYAQWKIVEYTITYRLDSDVVNGAGNPDKYTIETPDITLKAPTKPNYVFTGWTWDTQTTPQKVVKISKGTTGAKEYTANWRAADHTVIFDSKGGSAIENGFGTHNEIMEAPSNPTKEGYTFKGWYKEEALTNQWDFANDKVMSDMTLYAKWEINHYDVTFDTKGGSEIAKQTVDHGEKASKPVNDPTKEYYTFVGWYSDEKLETEFDFNTLIKEATTIYAKWNAKSYDITYKLDGGKNHKDNPASYTVEDEITLKSPTKENYTFVGWTWSGQSEPQKEVKIVKGSHDPITYQANWTLDEYSITYNLDGGTVSTENKDKYTVENDTFTLTNPTKRGYTFKGWSGTGITGKEKTVTITKGSTGDKSFTANWELNEYTIGYDLVGGTVSTANKNTYTVESDTFTLTNPTKKGYTFKGWSGTDITDKEDSVTITKGTIGNRTYTANWEIDTYTIAYELDGGTNHADNPATYQVIDSAITLKEPSKTGYAFKGWKLNGTGEILTSVIISSGSTGNLSYSAVFEKVNYKVTFDSQGGSPVSQTGADYQEKISKPVDPTKEGYTFKGWYKETSLTNQWDFANDKVISDMTLYAKWNINHYDVTFETNGGNTIPKESVDHGEKASKPANPTKDYYDFVGWYSDEKLETEFDFNTLIKEATTIYAKWNAKSYDITYKLNGGKNHKDNPVSYTVEDEITIKSPTKENYIFVGWTWSGQSEPQKEVKIVKGSHDPITYQANWKSNEYQVHFETNGGNTIDAITKEHGSKVTRPANPIKDNYAFVGWYSDEKLTKAWNFDIDVVTKEMTLYAKYYEILHNVTASSSGAVEKNTKITLSSKEDATIYYTVDGSNPSKDSMKYTGAILIDKTMSIKAFAVKEGYGDSEVTTFEYIVKGNSAVESEKDSPLKPENKKDEIIEAVLTEKEYQSYLSGTDVSVRITCNTTTQQFDDIIKNVLDGRVIGAYYDITIYKTVGDKEETVVTTLRKPIRFILTIPTTLYPEKGVTRVFDVIRIHDDKADLLSDLDKDETTVTIESDAFSTYILCYKDTKTSEEDTPVIAPIEKPTTGDNAGSQVTDKPKQGITSNPQEDKKEEPNKEDVTKSTDEKESKKEEANNVSYYVAIPLAVIIGLGIVIFMKLRRRNKE